ncbi:MAG: hypothetical protein AAF726_16685 [Planctomycetota bacterium]
MTRPWTLLALFALGCGDANRADTPEPDLVPAWGLPGGKPNAGASDTPRAASDVVLFVVLDGVERDELALWGGDARSTPRIDAVAAGAEVFDDAVAVATGGNAGVASMLSGMLPPEHGVGSLRDQGRASLAASITTISEAFQGREWTTIASLSDPRHARGLSGFSAGFDVYEAPQIGAPARDAAAVGLGARTALEAALEEPGKGVFAFVVFGDVADRWNRVPPPDAVAAPFVAERLAPFAERLPDVASNLERIEVEPSGAVSALRESFGRARGSQAALALERALRDGHLAAMDRAVGELLDAIESAGRAETATVVVCAPRGRAPESSTVLAGARLRPSLIDVPLIVRWTGGRDAGRRPETTSVVEVTRSLARAFELPLATTDDAPALVFDTRFTIAAVVDGDEQIERYRFDDRTYAFARTGDLLDREPDAALVAALNDAFSPAEIVVERGAGAGPVDVRWRAADGRVLASPADSVGPRVWGARTLGGDAPESLSLQLESRATDVLIELDAQEVELRPADVALGSARLDEVPVLWVPSEDGPAAAPDESAIVRIGRAEGLWWKLDVTGEGPVELLVATWPPRTPEDSIEVVAGGPAQRTFVPGRGDLVRIAGTAPFDVRVKRSGDEEFAISCRLGDRFVRPDEFIVDDLRYASPTNLAFIAPGWQPRASEDLAGVSQALYAEAAADAPIVVRRTAIGPVRGVEAALERDALLFLKALPSGE